MLIAKSLVIVPDSTVSITVFSNLSQKSFNSALLSNLALWAKPLVQAKILAILLVEVAYPF